MHTGLNAISTDTNPFIPKQTSTVKLKTYN